MKKWLIMVLALLAFAVLPTSGTELGELHPVSLLLLAGKLTARQHQNR